MIKAGDIVAADEKWLIKVIRVDETHAWVSERTKYQLSCLVQCADGKWRSRGGRY